MTQQKILIVDDDQDVLDVYKELLARIPGKPEVHVARSGKRALAMLDSDTYRILICDLHMPKMDGLQVLSVTHRRFPRLKTIALTGVVDEQFRSRVYSIGVDLYWHKPSTEQEIKQFIDCCESLMGSDDNAGFRGIQSKSLMDIVQLECMSQSSSILKINNGASTGKIWIKGGEVIDAQTGDLHGEEAFYKIFSWQNGSFQTQPADDTHPKRILKSCNSLLLEAAQGLDERQNQVPASSTEDPIVAAMSKIQGVEFVLAASESGKEANMARGLENPEALTAWTRRNLERFGTLGEQLHAGALLRIEAKCTDKQLALTKNNGMELCVGFPAGLPSKDANDAFARIVGLWS